MLGFSRDAHPLSFEILKEKELVLDASAFNQIIKTCLQLEDHRKQGKVGEWRSSHPGP